MASITKHHARAIAKKLKARIDTSGKAHDVALIYHDGVLIASFGLRRGSNRNLPHNHVPADLHLSRRDALSLATCTMTADQWLAALRDAGWIPEE